MCVPPLVPMLFSFVPLMSMPRQYHEQIVLFFCHKQISQYTQLTHLNLHLQRTSRTCPLPGPSLRFAQFPCSSALQMGLLPWAARRQQASRACRTLARSIQPIDRCTSLPLRTRAFHFSDVCCNSLIPLPISLTAETLFMPPYCSFLI